MKEELDWAKLEPMYIRVYQKSFTEEEVASLVVMYKSPAGQLMINKMPLVMQNTMAEMQTILKPMMKRLQSNQAKLVADLKAGSNPSAN